MPSKSNKRRKKERLQAAQLQQSLQPQSLAGDQTSEHRPSASYEPMPSTSSAPQQIGLRESLEELQIAPKETPKQDMRLVPKPPPSEIGTEITLISNHFPLTFPSMLLYHFDVTIVNLTAWKESDTSSPPSAEATGEDVEKLENEKKNYRCFNTKTNRELLQKVLEDQPEIRYVYDGKKNLFTPCKTQILLDKIVPFQNKSQRECSFQIEIKPVRKPDSNDNSINLEILKELFQRKLSYIPEDAILAVRTILRNQPALTHIPIGRSFFPIDSPTTELSGGRIVKKGYHQSVLLTQSNAILNIDTSATTFYQPGPVIEFLRQLINIQEESDAFRRKSAPKRVHLETLPALNDHQRTRLANELMGCRIYATHFEPHRKYKVHGVSEKSADQEMFHIDGETISVTQYFREKYKKDLVYGRFPCLKISKKRNVYLPIEVCEIPEGEHCLKQPSKLQVSKMIKHTAVHPQERFHEIQETVNDTIEHFGSDLKMYGITIKGDPIEVAGRILDSPELSYRRSTKTPHNGQWNVVNSTLRMGITVDRWAIVGASSGIQPKLYWFAQKLKGTAIKFGLGMQQVSEIICPQNSQQAANLTGLLKEAYGKVSGIQLVVVVLRSKNDKDYSKIKYVAENELGVITQCLSEQNLDVRKCNEQFLVNLCLKINGKLGGQNSILEANTLSTVLDESTMIVGADCNHPGPNDEVQYSIAATVCNLDPEMAHFAAAYTIQLREKNKRIELMKKLKYMVIELLKLYYNKRKKYPSKIIFFRDGVSEGEYEKALDEEVPQVREACREVIRGECPKITFLIISKRHHTRFMQKRSQENIPPGTKVDTGVTHILNFDFFLCSHKAIKGTSRPAHYTVICDDNNFSSRENKPKLERLCYFLCHISARCTRSTSIPAPVVYADLAAYRAKQYLLAAPSVDDLVSEWSDGIKVASEILDKMYFI